FSRDWSSNVCSSDREGPGGYVGARVRPDGPLEPDGVGFVTSESVSAGEPVALPLVGLRADELPDEATAAALPEDVEGARSEVVGVVWLDFQRGGGGEAGVVDEGERGLPGIEVEAVAGSRVVASATTEGDGSFRLDLGAAADEPVRLRLTE